MYDSAKPIGVASLGYLPDHSNKIIRDAHVSKIHRMRTVTSKYISAVNHPLLSITQIRSFFYKIVRTQVLHARSILLRQYETIATTTSECIINNIVCSGSILKNQFIQNQEIDRFHRRTPAQALRREYLNNEAPTAQLANCKRTMIFDCSASVRFRKFLISWSNIIYIYELRIHTYIYTHTYLYINWNSI